MSKLKNLVEIEKKEEKENKTAKTKNKVEEKTNKTQSKSKIDKTTKSNETVKVATKKQPGKSKKTKETKKVEETKKTKNAKEIKQANKKETKKTNNNKTTQKKNKIEDKEVKENKKFKSSDIVFDLIISSVVVLAFIITLLKPNLYYIFLGKLKIEQIIIDNYNEENNTAKLTINLADIINKNGVTCYLSEDDNISEDDKFTISKNNKCEFVTEIKDYNIILKNHNDLIVNTKKVTDYVKTPFYIKVSSNKVYLAIGGEQKIDVSIISIQEIQNDITWISENSDIATVENGKITGISKGTTNVVVSDLYQNSTTINVIVTDLIETSAVRKNKPLLKGEVYNLEEADLLDKILSARVNDAGFGTRAGVIAAARFLTLEFPYSIPYFFENGRLNKSGFAYVDGEGRYYHRGLYLHKSKFETIEASYVGPAIWGMPLTNFENAGRYVKYAKLPNGLDCSGFVSWAIHNGGFDPGDYGAGENPEIPNQMTDLGEYTRITKSLLDSGKVKAGDLINWTGHIGIIVGIDGETYYVSETLDSYGKLVVRTYEKSNNLYPFTHIVLMDSYYKEDGKYTKMWETLESQL